MDHRLIVNGSLVWEHVPQTYQSGQLAADLGWQQSTACRDTSAALLYCKPDPLQATNTRHPYSVTCLVV